MKQLNSTATFFAGVQWLFFMFANTVVIPLSIGAAFALPGEEISAAMQRSFIYTGIACIGQALIGHRYALVEGQSGLWWGVILSLCASASTAGISLSQVGGALATGIILSGIIIAVLGLIGMGRLLNRIFTPVVMGAFLLLLACQLIQIFFRGMVGLEQGDTINVPVASLSLFIVVFVCWLNIKGKGLLSNFSILIGIIFGWVAYTLLIPEPTPEVTPSADLLTFFPWGSPNFTIGIVLTAVISGLLNTTNTIASIKGAEMLYGEKVEEKAYRRSFAITGASSVISGIFGLVPYAPYTSSIGFLQSTGILQRSPFIVGAILFSLLGFVPSLSAFFSTLPISVGDAVLFVAYLQLFGSALRNIEGISFNSKTIYRIAAPVLLGVAIMNLPSSVFESLPMLIRPLISSGLLVGIILSILLENLVNWSSFESKALQRKSG